ncbi:MAG: heme-binding protein [Devosia sp.]
MQYDPQMLLDEEKHVVLDRFDYEIAWRLGQGIVDVGLAQKMPIAIQITHGLDCIFLAVLPGGTHDNVDWVRRKIASVHRFQHSSLYLALAAREAGYEFHQRFRLPMTDFVAGGGAVPLIAKNAGFIGAVGISGLLDTDDHRLAVDGIRAVMSL